MRSVWLEDQTCSLAWLNTEPFAAWFVVTVDVTADEIRVVRSVLGAISCHQLPSYRALGHDLQTKARVLLGRVVRAGSCKSCRMDGAECCSRVLLWSAAVECCSGVLLWSAAVEYCCQVL